VRLGGLKRGWTRDQIIADLSNQGVPVFQGSCSEVYLERAFDNSPWRPEQRLPIARELGETSLMFLTHPTLTDSEIDRTCDAIRKTLDKAGTLGVAATAA